MIINRICFLVFVFLFVIHFFVGFSFGYTGKGFSMYSEGENGISFVCDDICSLELGKKDNSGYLILSGTVGGTGVFEIFSKLGDKRKSLFDIEFSHTGTVGMNFENFEKMLYGVSKDEYLFLGVDGNIEGDLMIKKGMLSFREILVKAWHDFCEIERMNQMSIMRRFGISIIGVSILQYLYCLFILVVIIICIFCRGVHKKLKLMFYFGLGLFLFVGIRNTITYTFILDEGLTGYKLDKSYFDLRDYIPFVIKIRNELGLDVKMPNIDSCNVLMRINGINWAVKHHGEVYLWPCKSTKNSVFADYVVYYNMDILPEDLNKKVLVEFNGNYLLDNKLE